MSSRRKNKRTSPCPGCHLPKAEHGFGTMHKNCNRPDVSDSENSMEEFGAAAPSPSSKSKSPPSQANAELLQAVRALSDQVGALQIEQKSLREMVEKKGGGSPNKDTSATTSQDPPSDTGNVQPIKPGVYVDLTTLLPRVKTEKSSEAGSGDAKRKVTIESFDLWLEAWSVYEEKLMAANPDRYIELAHYRSIIQKANRKFQWTAVYDYDVQSI